jgi:hypothetical protein
MSISGRTNAAVKQFALWTMLCVVILAGVIAGGGFLIAALFHWISQQQPNPAAASAITGGALIGIVIIFALIGGAIIKKLKKPQPALFSEFSGMLGLGVRLITIAIRRDPRKAIIVSAIAGALAEFITSDRRSK